MNFDWLGYYQLSRELTGQTPLEPITQEARHRCAMSRAYYAVFNFALIYIETVEGAGTVRNDGGVHRDVYDYFAERTGSIFTDVADHLDYLRKERNKADYKAWVKITDFTAKQTVTRSALAIHRIGTLPLTKK